jgi:hypothetical protein
MDITKLDAAQSQLSTAIWLYLEDRDPVSVHTLATAAGEIIDHLCKHRGLKTMRHTLNEAIKSEKRKEVFDKMDEARNFFKHASWKKPDQKLEGFTDDRNLFAILFGAMGLGLLGQETLESKMFSGWISVVYPSLMVQPPVKELLTVFGDILNQPRAEQKKIGLDALHMGRYGRLPD